MTKGGKDGEVIVVNNQAIAKGSGSGFAIV